MLGSYVGVGLWTAVEIDLAVVSCCLPMMRPMLAWLIPEAVKNKRTQEFFPLHNNENDRMVRERTYDGNIISIGATDGK